MIVIFNIGVNVFQKEVIDKTLLLKRLGTAKEISAATTFLASNDASYITGETLVVAGRSRF